MPSSGRRILVTEASSTLASRVAQRLELDPRVEAVVTVDDVPSLAPILRAARIDTVIDVGLVGQVQSGWVRPGRSSGTPRLLRALDAPGCRVGKLVFASSVHCYGFGSAPAFFGEDVRCRPPQRAGLQRQVLEAEEAVRRLAARDPGRMVTILRLAEDIGSESRGPHMALLGLPAIPSILGFDPRWQLVEQHDVIGALLHAAVNDLPGTYNVAADGVLALSEVASLLGKPLLPILPPIGADRVAAALRRLGLPAPVELVGALRFGRGLDNRRLKSAGYAYRFTSREAVIRLRNREQEPEAWQGTLQPGAPSPAAPLSPPARSLP
jgi:UDP-glucose 4-epimerase